MTEELFPEPPAPKTAKGELKLARTCAIQCQNSLIAALQRPGWTAPGRERAARLFKLANDVASAIEEISPR